MYNLTGVYDGFCKYLCYLITEVVSSRVSTITSYKLAKFKEEIMKTKPELLRSKVEDIISDKMKKAQHEAIADAVAKAKADSEAQAKASADATLMGRLSG